MRQYGVVVPSSDIPYFTVAATAAGTLIGLLFVAIAPRPDSIFGEKAAKYRRSLAGNASTERGASAAVTPRPDARQLRGSVE